ncbi:MAG: hypothetical protein M1840_001951 [Geoglossum simile]|nr:MAG: hypothetical protein M1840_001951 [Geoglossum simile]
MKKDSLPHSAISGTTEPANKGLSLRTRETAESPPTDGHDDTSCKVISDTISKLERVMDSWDSEYPEIAIPVTAEQFEELQLKVKEHGALEGWFEDKARYEYNSEMEKLFLRYPSSQHDHIASDLTVRIANEVERRANDPEVPQHARKRSIFQPDVSFIPTAVQNPSFVTEIAYSQIEKDLAKQAETIQEAKDASLTIGKANFKIEDNKNVLTTDQVLGPLVYLPGNVFHRFVDQLLIGLQNFIVDSQFVPGDDIILSITNFAGPDELDDIPDKYRSESITLPLQFFYDIVMKAKGAQEAKSKPKRKREDNSLTVGSKVRPEMFDYSGIRMLSNQLEDKNNKERQGFQSGIEYNRDSWL